MTVVAKESVGDCSTCQECGLRISDETTPLLDRQRSKINYFAIILLFFGLLVGASVGIYLLIEEIRSESEQPFPELMHVVTSNGSLNGSGLQHPRSRIELIEILGPPCENDIECRKQMFNWRSDFAETPNGKLHFLVDANASAYEQLGFDSDCTDCDNSTLLIALSGTNTGALYSESQRIKIENLIKYGVENAKLTRCCVVSATKEQKLLAEFAKKIQGDINVWYNCTH